MVMVEIIFDNYEKEKEKKQEPTGFYDFALIKTVLIRWGSYYPFDVLLAFSELIQMGIYSKSNLFLIGFQIFYLS
ncbi:hypothetical protein BpHYR1_053373 [Brachionus plicatilis]|uniref:Uncharacterized protein n=1 Tax=Brachionus plicatilis TaxID=10195 RepID=A0A3M7S7N9_BRAPC|nr:hypothetical protein BpHYR1_053373 [Brachionus plicatilis]